MNKIANENISEIDAESLSLAMRYHRKKAGLNQYELAKLAGVGKTVIFDLEKNKKTVRMDTLLKVLEILNIKVSFTSPIMETYLSESREAQ